MDKVGGSACGDGQRDGHAHGGNHEHLPAADDVVESRSYRCEYPAIQGIDDIKEQFHVNVRDADVGEHHGQVVGDDAAQWDQSRNLGE